MKANIQHQLRILRKQEQKLWLKLVEQAQKGRNAPIEKIDFGSLNLATLPADQEASILQHICKAYTKALKGLREQQTVFVNGVPVKS
jgi:hypothetical protein